MMRIVEYVRKKVVIGVSSQWRQRDLTRNVYTVCISVVDNRQKHSCSLLRVGLRKQHKITEYFTETLPFLTKLNRKTRKTCRRSSWRCCSLVDISSMVQIHCDFHQARNTYHQSNTFHSTDTDDINDRYATCELLSKRYVAN